MPPFNCLLKNFISKGTKLIKKNPLETFKVSQEAQKEKAERT